MRIALVLTQLEPAGAQRVALDIADELRRRGHVVQSWFLYEKVASFQDRTGIEIISTGPPKGVGDFFSIVAKLRSQLQAFAPDATIGFTHYANIIASVAAASLGIQSRLASQQNPATSYPRIARLVDAIIGSLGAYTANVAVSRAVLASFGRYPRSYRSRLSVVYNGTTALASTLTQREARLVFNIPHEAFVVVAVGRLSPQKNHELLIRAIARTSELQLFIAGGGELRTKLACLAEELGLKDRVTFLGPVPPNQMPSLMRASDLFAMPSRFEGLSLALLEALQQGMPVVSSSADSQVEVLSADDGAVAGLLVPSDEPEDWAVALRQLAADAKLRDELGSRARARAIDFSFAKTVDGYEQLITASLPRR